MSWTYEEGQETIRGIVSPTIGLRRSLRTLAQNVPRAIRENRQGHEDRLVRDRPVAADIDPDRVHEDDRIAGLQGAVLPGGDLLHDRVGDRRNQAGRGFDAVDFLDMPLNLAGRHAPGIHADDLAIELGKAPLILGDQQRIEGAVPVTGDVQDNLAAVGGHRLLAAAIAPIGGLVLALRRFFGALFIKMDVHLRAQRTFRQRLGQFRQDAGLTKQIARRAAFHQPVQKVFVDAHTWVSSQSSYHVSAQNSG